MGKESKKSDRFWKQDPVESDFAGALDYLSLLMRPDAAEALVEGLRNVESTQRKAKDLLRAATTVFVPAITPTKTPRSPVASLIHRGSQLVAHEREAPK